jgi:hypothetical protein
MPRVAAVLCLACLAATAALASWRSSLYPETGYDPAAANLDTDKVLQDFSYAGYRAGAAALPDRTGPVFDVTAAPYQADPTGVTDATAAIQSAINAAESAGGGVVYLPAGTYRLSVPAAQTQALLIDAGNVVLRGAGVGQTFLLNTTTTNLRSKAVIRVRDGTEMSFYRTSGTTSVALSRDLLNSTTVIPVASTAGFAVGDTVVVRNDIGDDWINEHGETLWLGQGSSLGGLTYRRTVVAVDPAAKTLTVDAPTRYALKLRDGARVIRLTRTPIAEIGLEDFSFANVQSEATTGWGEDDYGISGTAAYEINGFFFIVFERVKDSWMRRLATYQPAGNTTTAHLLSGAFSARECTHLTVEHCFFQRPQYGGGGGNGYMFRLLDTGESLIQSCEARFSRHGFQFSGTGAAGNVIHASLDAITGRATGAVGAAGYATGGRASDHHQHFSQANLVDTCTAEDSWFEARYRGTSGTVPHGISAAHSVFWNTAGTGTSTQAVVKSEQARYGYVIGTRGNRTNVDILNTTPSKHGPLDHLEGAGEGDTLAPFSLFQDQRARRLGAAASLPADLVLPYPANTAEVTPLGFFLGSAPIALDQLQVAWEADPAVQLTPLPGGGVRAVLPGAGEWTLTCATTYAGYTQRRTLRVSTETATPTALRTLAASADTFVEGTTSPTNQTNTNWGTDTLIRLKRASTAHTTRHGLLRFDLTALGADLPTAARLVLRTGTTLSTYAGWEISVRPILTAWEENTATWNNQPTYGDALATYAPSPTQVDVIDLTDSVLAAWGAGATALNLALVVNAQPDTSVFAYYSRENPNGLGPRLEIDAIPAAHRFTHWIAQSAAASDQRAPTADPDGDGLANLLEMLLGTDPAQADAAPALQVDGATAQLTFSFAHPAPAFSQLSLEQSTDLATWNRLPIAAAQITALGDDRRQVQVPVTLSTDRQFWRLRIEPESGATIP